MPPVPSSPLGVPSTAQLPPTPDQPPASPQKRGVRVTIELAELTVDPGGEVTTTVTVRNLGTRVEEFRLAPSGPAAPFASISPTTLSVYPGDEQRAEVRFAPVRGPQSPAGVARFEIVARSAIQADVIDAARGHVTVTPFPGLSAVLRPEVSRGRRPGRHRVSATNGGNTPVNAQLAFRDQNGELTFEPPGGATTLPPGGTLDYSVRINGPHRWFGRTERHPFSAVLTPTGTQPPITLNGTRQQTAVFPWWIPIAAAIIVALVLPLFFLFKPAPPTVPQVGDFTQTAAEKKLRDSGYMVSGATPIADPKQAGRVVKTDPAAGSPLKKQERVELFVSTGPCNPDCKKPVPATKGRTEAEARAALGAAGFTVGEVLQGASTNVPAGRVTETSPAELTEVSTKQKVSVFVSSGATLTSDQLASYQGKSVADVKKALGTSAKVEEMTEHTNEFAAGKVRRVIQDPNDPRRVTLIIAAPTATDLVAMAGKARWRSSAGPLVFPGKVTDAKGAVAVGAARLPDGTTGKVLGVVPPKIGAGSVTGLFTLSANQKIIPGDRLRAKVGLMPGAGGQAEFTVKVGGQLLPLALTAEPGQVMEINAPLDEFNGLDTIEIAVISNPSASPTSPSFAAPSATASQAFWQNLRIEGMVKNP